MPQGEEKANISIDSSGSDHDASNLDRIGPSTIRSCESYPHLSSCSTISRSLSFKFKSLTTKVKMVSNAGP
jgi:hypothetical protein